MKNNKYLSSLKRILFNTKTACFLIGVVVSATVIAFFLNNVDSDDKSQVHYNVQTSSNDSSIDSKVETKIVTSGRKKASVSTSKKIVSSTQSAKDDTSVEEDQVVDYNFPTDINTITKEHLMAIDGIGEVLADRILEYRDNNGVIRNLDLLIEVSGIGEATLEKLKNYLYVSDWDYEDISDNNDTEISNSDIEVTTITTTTQNQITTSVPEMKEVNINTASAQEISESLLIDIELANEVVQMRENIGKYVNSLELLLVDNFTESMLVEREDFILL